MKTIHVTYENIQITVNETDTTLVKLFFSENNKFLVFGSKSKTHYNTQSLYAVIIIHTHCNTVESTL